MSVKTHNLDYLQNRPKKLHWKVVAGPDNLSFYQKYDLIFDLHDLKIRRMDTPENLKRWKELEELRRQKNLGRYS